MPGTDLQAGRRRRTYFQLYPLTSTPGILLPPDRSRVGWGVAAGIAGFEFASDAYGKAGAVFGPVNNSGNMVFFDVETYGSLVTGAVYARSVGASLNVVIMIVVDPSVFDQET